MLVLKINSGKKIIVPQVEAGLTITNVTDEQRCMACDQPLLNCEHCGAKVGKWVARLGFEWDDGQKHPILRERLAESLAVRQDEDVPGMLYGRGAVLWLMHHGRWTQGRVSASFLNQDRVWTCVVKVDGSPPYVLRQAVLHALQREHAEASGTWAP